MENIKINKKNLSEEENNIIITNLISLIRESDLNINKHINELDIKIEDLYKKTNKKNELIEKADELLILYEEKNQELLIKIEKNRNRLLEKLGVFL